MMRRLDEGISARRKLRVISECRIGLREQLAEFIANPNRYNASKSLISAEGRLFL